jgi:hypothetical protein
MAGVVAGWNQAYQQLAGKRLALPAHKCLGVVTHGSTNRRGVQYNQTCRVFDVEPVA